MIVYKELSAADAELPNEPFPTDELRLYYFFLPAVFSNSGCKENNLKLRGFRYGLSQIAKEILSLLVRPRKVENFPFAPLRMEMNDGVGLPL